MDLESWVFGESCGRCPDGLAIFTALSTALWWLMGSQHWLTCSQHQAEVFSQCPKAFEVAPAGCDFPVSAFDAVHVDGAWTEGTEKQADVGPSYYYNAGLPTAVGHTNIFSTIALNSKRFLYKRFCTPATARLRRDRFLRRVGGRRGRYR